MEGRQEEQDPGSEADAGAPYLEMASETYAIGPAPARESYLNQDLIIDVLRKSHADGLHLSAGLSSAYRNQHEHDPRDIDRAREIASQDDPIPVGILYRNPEAPCYEDLRHAGQMRSPAVIRSGLNRELDKYTVWPEGAAA